MLAPPITPVQEIEFTHHTAPDLETTCRLYFTPTPSLTASGEGDVGVGEAGEKGEAEGKEQNFTPTRQNLAHKVLACLYQLSSNHAPAKAALDAWVLTQPQTQAHPALQTTKQDLIFTHGRSKKN